MLTVGNSDLKSSITPKEIIELDQSHPYSLTTSFTPDQSTNYYILVTNESNIIMIIFMIDSTGWYCNQMHNDVNEHQCGVSIDTVKWVDRTLEE